MENSDIRADFPLLNEIIYLDAASTTPTPVPVIEAISDYYTNFNANTGRGAYKTAVKATTEFEKSRSKIAKFINSTPEEIIFTKNTTEAINLVANGFGLKKGDSVILTNIEHHSNLVPWLNLKKKGITVKLVKANEYGVVTPSNIEKEIDKTTKLITITHISNAIGTVQPVSEIGEIAEDKNVKYLIDAAQSAGHMNVNTKDIKADFMAFPGHKGLLGPVGTGFLYADQTIIDDLNPQNLGGGTVVDVSEEDFIMEQAPAKFEGGTQNIAGFIGLGVAIDYLGRIGMDKIERHSRKLTHQIFSEIDAMENTTVYGRPENIYGIVAFNINGVNNHDVAKILDEKRSICVRSGYHCAIPTIKHIGAYELGGTVRASLHYYNTKEEVQTLIETLEEISKLLGD